MKLRIGLAPEWSNKNPANALDNSLGKAQGNGEWRGKDET